ncbi:MAG: glycosyl hydrolase family 39 [Acidobacteriota bacterium]|nr:glycosyl hydrolase family 39 [Acidobacteriota bacterium]
MERGSSARRACRAAGGDVTAGKWLFRSVAAVLAAWLLVALAVAQSPQSVTLHVDANAAGTPFPHFWEKMFGSGRAILTLRQSYQDDLVSVRDVTGFDAVRAHGIFMDEVGLYDPDRQTLIPAQTAQRDTTAEGIYNFTYIDQIYDALLAHGVRPFVELSFMPRKLASDPARLHGFWYHPNVTPPKDYAGWDAMLQAFARHLVARYGLDEVSHWDFEVWNEPNLDFWGGSPKQPTYWELYDHTARALKSVSLRLRVGGPSTAQAAWVAAFLQHCHDAGVPVDFVSTHVYANDSAKDVFGTTEQIPRDAMVCRSVAKVHGEIAASPYPQLPLIFSEYNASYANEPNVTDSTYMGPWLANTIRQCDGLTEAMSYWTFSDVFEEQGVERTPFYGGFGLIAAGGIRKPAFHAFAMLHQLGETRLPVDSDSALATRRADGRLALALWNYAPPDGTGSHYTPPGVAAGPTRHFLVQLQGVDPAAPVTVLRVDSTHGNVLAAYDAMGRPANLTLQQLATLRQASAAAPPEVTALEHGQLQLDVPAHGLALLLVGAAQVH